MSKTWRVTGPSDELQHYGVLGMKWGVRRTSEELGHRPTREENRKRKQLTKDLAAAQKNLVMRTRMSEGARNAAYGAEKTYEKALMKTPWLFGGQARKEAAIEKTGDRMEKLFKSMERPESKRVRANDIANEKKKELVDYVNSLNQKYGSLNVKQLQSKQIKAGKDWVIAKGIKTGIHTETLPIIGNRVSGKKVSEWEKSQREELMTKRARSRYKNGYY